jgi:hypothetical protein
MPTLRDLMAIVCRHAEARGVSFGEQCARDLETEIRRAFPAERVYIPPADSRKDPGRAEAIRQAAKRLPHGGGGGTLRGVGVLGASRRQKVTNPAA